MFEKWLKHSIIILLYACAWGFFIATAGELDLTLYWLPGMIGGYGLAVYWSGKSLSAVWPWLALTLCLLLQFFVGRWWNNALYIHEWLGVATAFNVGEVVLWTFSAFLWTAFLRGLSRRHSAWLALELTMILLVLLLPVADHRLGNISRPIALIDRTWLYGYDPVTVFITLGAAILVVLLIFIMTRSSHPTRWFEFILLFLMLLVLYYAVPVDRIIDRIQYGSGGGNKEEKEGGGQGKNGAGSGVSGTGTDSGARSSGDDSTGRSSEQSGQSGQGDSGGKNSSGKDDQISWYDRNKQDNNRQTPVAIVNFLEEFEPVEGFYYFRQSAYSRFNGIRLVAANRKGVDEDILYGFPSRETVWGVDEAVKGELNEDLRFITLRIGLLKAHTGPPGLVNPVIYRPLRNHDPRRFKTVYEEVSLARTVDFKEMVKRKVGEEYWNQEFWQHYCQAPADPRYHILAEEIIAHLPDNWVELPVANALAIKLWLDENCIYNDTANYAGEGDQTAAFLFGPREGYCVHLAYSAAWLMRSIGLPVRLCGGYAVNARDKGAGNSLLIDGKNSHLWPELYVRSLGWVIVDISPSQVASAPNLSNDQRSQQMMGEMLRQAAGEKQELKEQEQRQNTQEIARRALETSFSLFLVALLALYGIKIYRRIIPHFARRRHLLRVSYRAMLDTLADCGRARPMGMPRIEWARQMENGSGELIVLTLALEQSVWSRERKHPLSQEEILLYSREAGRSVRNRTSSFRFFIGLLNPISWRNIR